MRLTQNAKAISGLSLILLLLTSAIVGALLSYLWVVGYYVSMEKVYPENAFVTVKNATFDRQNTRLFNVTIECPTSYEAKEPATITRLLVSTNNGTHVHDVAAVDPPLPYKFSKKGESKTFKCTWNWANYTGQAIGIGAVIGDGSRFMGPDAETPFVDLSITAIDFDPSISVTRFNMTVENSNSSVTHVDVSNIVVSVEGEAPENVNEVTPITPALPYTINSSASVSFVCSWNWIDYQGKNVTIIAETTQGYVAYYPEPPKRTALPPPTDIQITDVLFNAANTTRFNVTVRNSEDSTTYVNITSIDVAVENEAFPDLPVIPPPNLPYTLYPGADVTFKCSWNWTVYREEIVEIFVNTLQNFTESRITGTTGRVILTITDALFDVSDMNHFNFTVQNSPFSLEEYVNITSISLQTLEDSWVLTDTEPNYLNYTLKRNDSVTFECEWDWTYYRGENVSIIVLAYTRNQSYYAEFTETTPPFVILNITKVSFNLSDTTHFNVTVENSQFSLDYVFVMDIAATFENGIVKNVTVVPSRSLPHVLHPNQSASFMCLWDWSDYRGEDFTVTVYTQQEYLAESTLPMPFVITEVLFNATDIEHFTITIQNSATSITYANITEITVTVEDGAPESVTQVTPPLPHTLYPNKSESFVCTWNWTAYEGKEVTIAVHTLQGYTAYASKVMPERVILEIADILFNITDTTHFNVTVESSEFSVADANITEITVTINGGIQNITEVVPLLPYTLQSGANVTFSCSWNWTDYRGQTVTITIRTSRGYLTSTERTLPTA